MRVRFAGARGWMLAEGTTKRAAILYPATKGVVAGLPTDSDPFDWSDESVAGLAGALARDGWSVVVRAVTLEDVARLPADLAGVDLAFNLCDGCTTDGIPGVEAVLELERLGIPFTGMGSVPYALSCDKLAMKRRFARWRVPTPRWRLVGRTRGATGRPPAGLGYPLIVKPRDGFASLGVSERSVVGSARALRDAIATTTEDCKSDALVEEFVGGRELTVGVLGLRDDVTVLAPAEALFGEAYAGLPHIQTYEALHDVLAPLYRDFTYRCPADLDPDLARAVEDTARRAYLAIGGDGYGRVDIRVGADGVPQVLEVNANTIDCDRQDDFAGGALPIVARGSGIDYESLVRALADVAFRKHRLASKRSARARAVAVAVAGDVAEASQRDEGRGDQDDLDQRPTREAHAAI